MSTCRLACYVSPHGLGHAARTAAILVALRRRMPTLAVDIHTTVPAAFFTESGIGPFRYQYDEVDLGMVQASALEEDLPATIARLESMLPFRRTRIAESANALRASGVDAVLCDIAPLGLAVAREAGLPSVLVENFTWDWIYAGTIAREPRFAEFVLPMRAAFDMADHHLQTEPVCRPDARAHRVGVVARRARAPRQTTRAALGFADAASIVLVTGGVLPETPDLDVFLNAVNGFVFVLAGAGTESRAGNVLRLPVTAAIYHPDLILAADVVIGKLGYSTVAEVYRAGTPYGYVARPHFPESPVLASFVAQTMPAAAITGGSLADGRWLDRLPALAALGRVTRTEPDGAEEAAAWLEREVLRA